MSNYENRVQRDLVTDAVFPESNEEFILPDYMPEIGRVLRVGATLLPDEPYRGGDSTEFSGRLEYRLLYSDSEGNVTEAPLEGRYRYTLPNGEGVLPLIYTEERIDSVNARPTAPRKLGIRTRIHARPHMLREEEVGVSLEAMAGGAPVETIEREIDLLARYPFSSGTLVAEEVFTEEETSSDTLSLISVLSSLLPESCEVRDGYISVRGKLIFTLLLKKTGEIPYVKTCSIPFEEEITSEGAASGDKAVLRGFVSAPAISFEESGGATAITVGAEYSLAGVLLRNASLSVLEDLYGHGACHDVTRKPFSADSLVGVASGNLTVGAELPLPADFRSDGCLFPAYTLKEATVTRVGDKAVAEGALSVSLLCFREGDTEKCELTLPFRAELPLADAGEGNESLALAVVPVGGSAVAAGGGVRLSTELALSVTSVRPISLSLPCGMIKTAEAAWGKSPSVTLYYPTDGDTLWSVGKRYGVPLSILKRINGIPEDGESRMPLDGYSYLFVNEL